MRTTYRTTAALLALSFAALGQHATFVADTDTIRVPGDTTISTAMTIEARVSLQPPFGGMIFDEQLFAKEDKQLWITSTGLQGGAYRTGPYPGYLSASVTWVRCRWTHVAFVVDGDEERLYKDGELVASRTVTGSVLNSALGAMAVGAFDARNEGVRGAFEGSIDWLRVSDVARYSGPVAAPPEVEPASDASTLLLYHFEEAAGATAVTDEGPNGWTGQPGTWFPGATAPQFAAPITVAASYCTAGTSASGCNALLSACGWASASAATGFTLQAVRVEGDKDGLFFFGANGRQANAWGSGTSYQCVVPPVTRGGLLQGIGSPGVCTGTFAQDVNALWQAQPQKNPGAGAVVQAQLWYRDPFNTSNQTTSLSDALEFTVQP